MRKGRYTAGVNGQCGTALDNNGNDIVAAIDFDWTEMGNNYGQWFADNCPGENIFVITGNFESVPCQRINEAMQAKVDELGKNKIIDIQEGEYNPSKAITGGTGCDCFRQRLFGYFCYE